jgi:hypothetical protein
MEVGITIIVVTISLFLYFLPSAVSSARDHHNHLAIFMLTLFLGWTLLGWVLSLVWACTRTEGGGAGAR